MLVAVVQLCSTEAVAENLATVERLVREAAGAGARFVALPENALFLRTVPGSPAPKEPLSGELVTGLRRLASELGIWLLLGSYPETSDDPTRYHNTSVLIDGTTGDALGVIAASYRKLHLFDIDIPGRESHKESDDILAGEDIVCTSVDGVPVGLTICYDLRFPTLYQRLVERGARIITVPAAFTEFTGKDHWLPLLRARAIETQTFVIAPNQSGHHGGKRRSYGKSVIIDPWGIPLATAADGPGWALARLDFAAQDRIRAQIPCLQNRHPRVC